MFGAAPLMPGVIRLRETLIMPEAFGFLPASRKSGSEHFHCDGKDLEFALLDFWQWSASDLVGNTARGILAEYVVARAVGVPTSGLREGWAAYDLETQDGLRIEVKSAAFVQSWNQQKLSAIQFVAPRKRGWDPETNVMEEQPSRHAHVYVFALLAHKDKPTVDPLNLSQWRFYVLPTRVLDDRTRSQHSITLASLEALAGPALDFWSLGEAVSRAGVGARRSAPNLTTRDETGESDVG